MISAFGVDHGHISKSFVQGQGYKAAAKLTGKDREGLKWSLKHTAKRRREKAAQGGWPGKFERKTTRLGLKKPSPYTHTSEQAEAFATPSLKGGGGTITHNVAKPSKASIAHEEAHLKPKRNAVRTSQRLSEPVRMGREEGRADYLAGRRPGKYPETQTPEFGRGYHEVQAKMTAAQRRKP